MSIVINTSRGSYVLPVHLEMALVRWLESVGAQKILSANQPTPAQENQNQQDDRGLLLEQTQFGF
jgi:hypothetical protein